MKHSHARTFLISLGGPRTLYIANKPYQMKSGDAVFFTDQEHEVKEEDTNCGRISIVFHLKN